jgi:hypothetical protein
VLSSTSPLLQVWAVQTAPGYLPYRLYAVSNAGSLFGLLSYPFLIEPLLSRALQAQTWSWVMVLYLLLAGAGAAKVGLSGRSGGFFAVSQDDQAAHRPGAFNRSFWLLLPACASMLLLAVTSQMSQTIAVAPFLWVLPLAAYLLSFVLCFARANWYHRGWWAGALMVSSALTGWLLFDPAEPSAATKVAVFTFSLFAACMVCHGELARIKPSPRHLTSFYLSLALGGVIGSALAGIVAPRVLSHHHELHLGWVFCWLLFLSLIYRREGESQERSGTPRQRAYLTVFGICFALALYFAAWSDRLHAIATERNFFGVLGVYEYDVDDPMLHRRVLKHGETVHGLQFVLEEKRSWPTTYYGEGSGAGLALRFMEKKEGRHIGVVGLGTGTLAAYAGPGDQFRFYEIDPAVEHFAWRHFQFLADTPAQIEVVLGDARLSLEREEPQQFDLLVLDAFTSGSIPVHLLTVEAFDLYQRHLGEGGLVAVHISNPHLDLDRVLIGVAEHRNWEIVLFEEEVSEEEMSLLGILPSKWALLARAGEQPGLPDELVFARRETQPQRKVLWTDEYNSLLPILRLTRSERAVENAPGQPRGSAEGLIEAF